MARDRRYFGRLSLPIVIAAYAIVVASALTLRLQFASGFGFAYFGVWHPPSDESFRRVCGIVSLSLLSVGALLVLLGLIAGHGWVRAAALACPLFALLCLWLAYVV